FLGCALALQLASACAPAPRSLPTPVAGSPVKIHAGPAMWKVSDKDTTIYLFGTVHFLPKGTEWFDGHIRSALQSSGELVTEIDSREEGKLDELIAQTAYLPAGENLRDKLGAEQRMAFEGLLVSLGIPIEQFDRYKPWSAGLYLSVLMSVRRSRRSRSRSTYSTRCPKTSS
ncbi:MAG: TraB family protein, partial [Proteobacteria bacterium]|nr:TraB family protein [Pseudomonadota bacterium]